MTRRKKLGTQPFFTTIKKGATYPMNIKDGVPAGRASRQEAFWTWTNEMVLHLVKDLGEQALALEMQAYLAAGWNQRFPQRRGYRNG